MVFATEGYQSSGSSDITVSEGNVPQPTNTPGSNPTSTPGGNAIIVRARGTAGGEHINLRIGGNVVANWNLTTSNANYIYSGGATGDIQVEFDNDGGSRDVILDYVNVKGDIRQAENMEYNTATYGNNQCGGGSFSETMHCNGVIGFGNTGTSPTAVPPTNTPAIPSPTATPGSSTCNIVVRARGTNGQEHINLIVGGNVVANWTLTTSNQNYAYNGNASGDIQVQFDNDASGRDVILDYIVVNGNTRQAENMEYNTATYGNGQCGGGSYSETMHCNGVIGFGTTGTSPTAVPPTNTPGANPTNTPVVPPTNTPIPSGVCAVNYNISNQWSTGFQANVTITNNSSSAIQGWNLVWTFAGNEQFSSGWNASFSTSGKTVTASNPASHWNGTIGANGGKVSFGVQGTHSGNVLVPSSFTVNGTVCNGGVVPTVQPTSQPTAQPTSQPTIQPTAQPTSTPVSGVDPNFHIYLMIGQSNMEGQGQISAQDNQVPTGLLVMHADNNCTKDGASYGQWRPAAPPLIRCYDVAHSWNNGGLGPGDYFGRTMLQNSAPGVRIGLVGAAYQGQSINFFLKDCAQRGSCNPSGANGSVPLGQGGYAWMLDLAKKAQQDGVIKGIIFHQGESDTGDASWPGKVNQMVTDLRNDLGIGNVPFIAGEMVPGACCTSHNTYVHQIETAVTNGHWVSASGLGSRDEYHFDAPGYRELGRRYANEMLNLVD